MKLLLRRDQKKALMGSGVKFTLDARAELSEEERASVQTYRMGKTMLFTNLAERGTGLVGWVSRAAAGIEITVDDLVSGKRIECKDIVEMIAIEAQLQEACNQFKLMLQTASQFGGEQVLEF